MSKNYAVARVQQYTKASISKSERHIERKNQNYENMNVDLSQTPRNVHFQSCGDLTYNATLDKMIEEGTVSLRGLKPDAKLFDEMIFDVNTAYFEEHGGYDYACRFYEEVFRFAQKEYGPENILSAVMHADELNSALTEKLGYPVYHYHLHVVALPVVEKEVRYSKRCKDPELVGKVKKVIHQISHSKKWASQKVTDEEGSEMPGLRTLNAVSAAAPHSICRLRSSRSNKSSSGLQISRMRSLRLLTHWIAWQRKRFRNRKLLRSSNSRRKRLKRSWMPSCLSCRTPRHLPGTTSAISRI